MTKGWAKARRKSIITARAKAKKIGIKYEAIFKNIYL